MVYTVKSMHDGDPITAWVWMILQDWKMACEKIWRRKAMLFAEDDIRGASIDEMISVSGLRSWNI